MNPRRLKNIRKACDEININLCCLLPESYKARNNYNELYLLLMKIKQNTKRLTNRIKRATWRGEKKTILQIADMFAKDKGFTKECSHIKQHSTDY